MKERSSYQNKTLDFDALYLRYKELARRRISEIIRDESQGEDWTAPLRPVHAYFR